MPNSAPYSRPAALSLVSGVILSIILPIGIWLGTDHLAYLATWFLHFAILLLATAVGVAEFLKKSTWYARCIFLILLLVITLNSLVPITNRDALIHHLVIPKWWLQSGNINQIHWHEWSYYPMLLDLGLSGLLKLGLDAVSPFYHALYLILLAAVVRWFIEHKSGDVKLAAIAFLVTLSIPICLKLATIPVVDLGLALYGTIAFVCVASVGIENRRALIASGVALGLALSTKYNGLLFASMFFPTLMIFGARSGCSNRAILRALLVIGGVSVLIFSPWLIKNYSWTGDPIFPLYKGLFGINDPNFHSPGLAPLLHQKLIYGHSWLEIALSPLLMLFIGRDGDPANFDGLLTPFFILALVTAWRERRQPWVVASLCLCVFYALFSQVYALPRVRYLAPIFGPLVILSALSKPRAPKYFIAGLLLHCAVVTYYAVGLFRDTDALSYLLGHETKNSYLTRHIPEFGLIEFARSALPHDAGIYLLFTGNRFYYYAQPVRSAGHFSGDEIIGWLKAGDTPEKLAAKFEGLNSQFILANQELTNSSLNANLSPQEREVWGSFASKYLELVRADGPFGIWRLKK